MPFDFRPHARRAWIEDGCIDAMRFRHFKRARGFAIIALEEQQISG
jgi:hypothetical protein